MVEINTDRKKLAKKYKLSEKIIQERQRGDDKTNIDCK